MAETTNHSVFKLPPPRLALITPSASPPISRTLTPHRSRSSSIRPPPSKRPRLSATPSSSSSLSRLTPSLSSSISTDQSLRDARRVSQLNILNFWDSLADRYNVPTDEDDIYDIEKDVLYKDRGYLRRAKKTFSFGCFRAGGADEDASSDNGGAQTEGEDVFDDVDEIDAFAPEPEADISGELEKSVRKLKQPIQEMNPADAEDLKQFLEAEKRRKELMGEEDEEDEGSSDILGSLAHGWGGEEEEEDEFSSFDEEIIPDGSSEPGPPESSSDGIVEPVMQCTETEPALTLDDEESEDEIATWVIDDTPILVNRTTPRAKSPSVVSKHEVIDLTTPSPPSSPPPLARSVSRTGDSPLPSVTPKRTSLAKSKTSAKKFGSVTSQEPVAIQLQTPPLSSPSHPPISDDPPDFRESLLPSSSPPPSSPTPRSASRPKPKPIFSGSRREASQYSDEPESLSRSSPVPNIDLLKISLSPKPSSKSRRVSTVPRSSSLRSKVAVEVVLPISSRRSLLGSPQVPSSVSPERNADSVRHGSQMKDIPTRNTVRKDKGKERDLGMGHIEWATQASNDRPPPSSPSSAPRKELTKRTSPQQSPASSNSRNSTQKRKRLASSSPSSSEDDEKNQPRMVPPSLPRVSTRNLAQLSTPKASGSPVKKQSSRTPHKDVDKSGMSSILIMKVLIPMGEQPMRMRPPTGAEDLLRKREGHPYHPITLSLQCILTAYHLLLDMSLAKPNTHRPHSYTPCKTLKHSITLYKLYSIYLILCLVVYPGSHHLSRNPTGHLSLPNITGGRSQQERTLHPLHRVVLLLNPPHPVRHLMFTAPCTLNHITLPIRVDLYPRLPLLLHRLPRLSGVRNPHSDREASQEAEGSLSDSTPRSYLRSRETRNRRMRK